MIFDFVGLMLGFILFFRHPRLNRNKPQIKNRKISVIIPARNEEKNIGNLIRDLKRQTYLPFEIIVVDDMSKDGTKVESEKAGAKVISIENKPRNWMGKTWACTVGSKRAKGDIFLFLDADVRMHKCALEYLVSTYEEKKETISVQPYHFMEKKYEHLSLLFNLIEVSANGVTPAVFSKKLGLFGPVILIDKKVYFDLEGHSAVNDKVVEDLSLGIKMTKRNIPFSALLGKSSDFSFQMYKDGYKSLWQGWVKNFATGASKTSLFLIILIVVWIGAGLSALVHLISAFSSGEVIYGIIFSSIYFLYGIFTYLESRKVGNYPFWIILLHPVYTLNFFAIFFVSLFKKVFRKKVIWKDRKIEGDK